MRIAVVSQNFYPEEFKINDLVEAFVKQGNDVVVLTGKPNYPKGEYYHGYKFSTVQKEEYKGAKVIRVPVVKRGRGGSLRLILNYLSFVLFGCWYVLFHKIQADAVFCFAPSPLLQVFPAILIKRKNKCKLSLWYQDLWPESIYAVTGKNNRFIGIFFDYLVNYIYKTVDKILVQSPAFTPSILRHGNYQDKIEFVPNWAEDIFLDESAMDPNKYSYLFPRGFIVMYAGNIGVSQDMPSILNAAKLLKDYTDIHFVIVGDGRDRTHAESIVEQNSLQNTVHFVGRYSFTEMPSFYVHATVMIVSLKDEEIFSVTIPSRIQSYMAFGKPIVTMLSGIGSRVVEDARCGLTANSGDYKCLADNILKLYNSDSMLIDEMCMNSKKYYLEHFDKNRIVSLILSNL